MKRVQPHHKETRGLYVGGKDLKEIKYLKQATKEETAMLQRAKNPKTRMASVRTRTFLVRLAKNKVDTGKACSEETRFSTPSVSFLFFLIGASRRVSNFLFECQSASR
jgi:hypothetical protein